MCVCSVTSAMSVSLPPYGPYLPGSSVHGILQAWVAMPYPGDLSDPRIKPISPASPALQEVSLPTEPPGKPIYWSCL